MTRLLLAAGGMVTAALALAGASAAGASTPNVPYAIGSSLPAPKSSPPVASRAPYTPRVRELIAQLEPSNPPTMAQVANAAKVLEGSINASLNPSCTAIGKVAAPAGTNPGLSPMCWADAVGINLVSGPNVGQTSASPEPLAIGSTFDTRLANSWGQVEGAEGRQLMVTGLYGPEADVSIYPHWERGLDTLGEDPYLNGVMSAQQVNGMQGRGLMAQVKHLAAFTGANRDTLTRVDDRTLHEVLLSPFEAALREARAASTMCAYEAYQDTSKGLPGPQDALAVGSSPFRPSFAVRTWPLGEPHWACEQPLGLVYALRRLWRSAAFVGSDYPATYSTSALTQGEAQEFPVPYFLSASDPATKPNPAVTVGVGDDPTGDTCAVGDQPASCDAAGARHVGGIPGAGCPQNGCGLVRAVATGRLPLAVFNQALAEMLYQQERFGLLGCDESPRPATCSNPGGVGGVRTGLAPLPTGPARGASAAAHLGTRNGDAAVVERLAEEGAVLLRNRGGTLPLSARDVRRGVAVTGAGAEYLVAAPSNEASIGFRERIAISPLRQLKAISGRPSAFSYTPALGPTGLPVPSAALSTTSASVDGALSRSAGPGAPRRDRSLDFTTASRAGRLEPGGYTWTGYVYVPRSDSYTFRFQSSAPTGAVDFSLDGESRSLSAASSFYCGQYFARNVCVPVSTTNAGYTQGGLTNEQAAPTTLSRGFHAVTVSFRAPAGGPASFRFAYSRARGDIADAAADAKGKAAALVFVNDNGVATVDQDAYTPPSRGVARLPGPDVALIQAVANANPNTIVVLNTADPVIVKPWIDNSRVKSVLEMWNAGSEGGTATARLLLGRANPSGRTVLTWPKRPTDTISAYRQTRRLYPGDRLGAHPERLNGVPETNAAICASNVPTPSPCTRTVLSQRLFSGYRFYDKQRLAPQFEFGFGLSYTRFAYSGLSTSGPASVRFTVRNTGRRRGTEVVQAYIGQPTAGAPVRQLAGFRRVALAPGAAARVTIPLAPRAFQYWDVGDQRWRTSRGCYRVEVGGSSRDLPLKAAIPRRGARCR